MTTKTVLARVFAIVFSGALMLAPVAASGAENDGGTNLPDPTEKFFRDTLEKLSQFSVDKRDETIQLAKELLDELDSQIYDLEMKIEFLIPEEGGALAGGLRNSLAALKNSRVEIDRWLGEIRQGSVGDWENVLSRFNDAFDETLARWNDVMIEFDKDVSLSGVSSTGGESDGPDTSPQVCRSGLEPLILDGSEKVKCVTPATAATLLDRGRAKKP